MKNYNEKEEFLQLVAKIRSEKKITSLDQPVIIYIADLHSGFYIDKYGGGECYMNIDTSFHLDQQDINQDIDMEEMLVIKKWEGSYRDLINMNVARYPMDDIRDSSSDYDVIEKTGESVEGSIIVEWSWEKYIGYCRNLHSINYADSLGFETESDLITGNEESTFKHNYSVLLTAKEIESLDEREIADLIMEELHKESWKWNYFQKGKPSDYVKSFLGDNIFEEQLNAEDE